ncbi:MAG: DUF2764 family protein [Salinivirgaceae bacterium]|nr:DUF2764 family protein [Salinivirgaceae bacterium]
MDNYVYIVAGLPDLTANFGSSQFSYAEVRESITDLLSDADCQLVALLDEGFDETALNADFYGRTANSKNRFIREYFDFDARMRNLQAEYVARATNSQADKYLVELSDAEFDDEKRVLEVLANTDFLQREQQADMLKWNKASEIAQMDYFNMNTILAFLVKAHIVQRWARLDREAGEAMFRKLLGEVRGTFKGVSA